MQQISITLLTKILHSDKVLNMTWDSAQNKQLIEALLVIKNKDEAERFLRDLMTEKEISEFGRRLRAAQLLSQDVSYLVIEKETGLSSTTIARVSKWLHGKEGGYKLILSRLHHHTSSQAGSGLS